MNNERTNTILRVRPATRQKYNEAKRIKGLPYCEVAERAINAFFNTDPELRKARTKATA